MIPDDTTLSRQCGKCFTAKPLSEFPDHALRRNRSVVRCRVCDNIAQRASYKNRNSPLRKSAKLRLFARLMSKVEIDPTVAWNGTPCWQWTGHINEGGYAQVWTGCSNMNAHRFVYMTFIGDIPDRLHGDHLCRRRHCVNPAHIEPVSPRVNTLRGLGPAAANAKKTHCDNGHAFTPENTYHYGATNMRSCRTCRRESERRNYIPSVRTPKTHCKQGHLLTEVNIDGPRRRCLICKNARQRRHSLRA